MSAVPAWYTGQKEASFKNAMAIDTTTWEQDGGNAEYTFSDNGEKCITVAIYDQNNTTPGTVVTDPDTTFTYEPQLVITKPTASPTGAVCKTLWDTGAVKEGNISMAGNKGKW